MVIFPTYDLSNVASTLFHSENVYQMFLVHTTPEKFETERRFHSENVSNVFSPYYAGEILKRRFYSEDVSNVFRPHYAGGIQNKTIIGHFKFVFEENSGRDIT